MGFWQNNKKGIVGGIGGFFLGFTSTMLVANKFEPAPEPEALPSVPMTGLIDRTPAAEPPQSERPTPAPTAVNAPKKNRVYKIYGERVTVTPRIFNALSSTGFPEPTMIALCARESKCKPKPINAYTKACGLFQIKPTTLYEIVFKYADTQYKGLVVRDDTERNEAGLKIFKYYPASDAAKTDLDALCLNPEFNAKMYAAYTRSNIEWFETKVGHEITPGQLILLNNLGRSGMYDFYVQLKEDAETGRDTMAADFFEAGLAGRNPSLIKSPEGELLTVTEVYQKIGSAIPQLVAN